jgi:hypothetical protein
LLFQYYLTDASSGNLWAIWQICNAFNDLLVQRAPPVHISVMIIVF